MRYRVRHETRYRYASDVLHSHQLLHLIPRLTPYQECIEHRLEILPHTYRRRDERDAFDNPVTRIELEYPHAELSVASTMDIDVHARPPLRAADSTPWEQLRTRLAYRGGWPARADLEACRFRHESAYVRVKRAFAEYASDCFEPCRPLLECAEALMTKLHRELRYAPGETTIGTPLIDVLESRRGVCQDFSHLMIACLRSRGLAARYVSGYVRLLPRPGAAASALDAAGAASHAWVSVYAPPLGWIDLDPTNDVRVGTDHVTLAWGRDFADVSPLRGMILGGGAHDLRVNVQLESI
ncbi:MAG TPA: transglutaminase family protein [Steroidobacteraceae bacterium]|nr:transglutaminase family protein [Steroidobacteraceae bacterium]